MKKNLLGKAGNLVLLITLLFLFSYLLNFVWESFHAVFLYEGHHFSSLQYVPMMGYISLIDGLLIIGGYGIVSLLWGDLFWLAKINQKKIFSFILIELIIALFIEYRAVFLQHRWSYNDLMPTIFGIGISPLLQLSVTGLISLFITKQLLYGEGILLKSTNGGDKKWQRKFKY